MERYMYQDDSFERMLKQKADEYRMYPSTETWNKIQSQVQKRNRFLNLKAVGLTVVLLSAFSLYISNNQEAYTKGSPLFAAKDLTQSETTIPTKPAVIQTGTNVRFTDRSESNLKLDNSLEPQAQTINAVKINEEVLPVAEQPQAEIKSTEAVPAIIEPSASEDFMLKKAENDHFISLHKPDLHITASPEQNTQLTITGNQPEAIALEESPSMKTDAELNYEVNVPIIVRAKEVKQLQLYFTPSISYRVLYADNKVTFGNLVQQDPENAAIHRAAIGFEAGAAIIFPTSKRIKFRTGVQFNYTHYRVTAFNSAPQLTTIRLNYSSIQRVTTLNNNYGYNAKDVANETFQVSIPVGVEIKLSGKKKIQWDMAANLQPSYLLKASGYLLTNDLKNYVKAPDLLSHLNLNTSLETFIRWNAGTFSLQAGPQLRYQLFSNARGEYPIREHLVDYGFRIGIVKPLR